FKERGYNQAELLAEYVSRYASVPMNTTVLTRVRNTMRQSGLKGTDRITNVAGAFKCGEDMRGKTIVLLDDIYTTGNTIQSCATPLKEAGAYRICAVTLAKHTFEKNPASMY
ncbi:MAG: ComF family protein, partial [Clostridia bacterium]|nr:ComF family protein [Clostridia bacterium]